jgi:hypothetical protein
MSEQRREDRTHEDAAERALIERIDTAYEPARLAPSARYALERDLWARIERRRRPALLRPVLAMVTVVAAVLWFARPATEGDTLTMAAAVLDAWEYDVLFADPSDGPFFDWAPGAGLPEEYASIEALLETQDSGDRDESDERDEGYEQ